MERRDFLLTGAAAAAATTLGCSREVVTTPRAPAPQKGTTWAKPGRFCGTDAASRPSR
jgi:hypothetical protein